MGYFTRLLIICFFLFSLADSLFGAVITELPVRVNPTCNACRVALTFDACETVTPSYFDDAILDYLLTDVLESSELRPWCRNIPEQDRTGRIIHSKKGIRVWETD
jgi:hypothetical protein